MMSKNGLEIQRMATTKMAASFWDVSPQASARTGGRSQKKWSISQGPPETHMVGGKSNFYKLSSDPIDAPWCAYTYTSIQNR